MMTLSWAEDQVGKRRVQLEKEVAIKQFVSGAQSPIQLDLLTSAYNDISQLPIDIQNLIKDKNHFIGEFGAFPNAKMIYFDQYYHSESQQNRPLIILMDFDILELSIEEIAYGAFYVFILLLSLLLIFRRLLKLLSQKLIDPLNDIESQLSNQIVGKDVPFEIEKEAADEFQHLIRELNHYRDENNKLLKREQAFARYASHELRTPLTIIQGANSLLRKKAEKPFLHKQINRIDEATTQMKVMVDALLSIVRYENSEGNLSARVLTKTELQSIVDNNINDYAPIPVEVYVTVLSEPTIYASEAIIQILVGNIIRNAIEASDKEDVAITMSDSILAIKDQGNGLIKSSPNGHGLGLLIVDELCRKFGWRFSLVENHDCRGCLATIHFNTISNHNEQ